jgi:hypothetical protein
VGEDEERAEEGVERCVSRGGGRGGRVKKSREQCSDAVKMLDMSSNILIKSQTSTGEFGVVTRSMEMVQIAFRPFVEISAMGVPEAEGALCHSRGCGVGRVGSSRMACMMSGRMVERVNT